MLLSSRQLDLFRSGQPMQEEVDVKAEKGAFLVQSELTIAASSEASWALVADVHQGPSDVAETKARLQDREAFFAAIREDVQRGRGRSTHQLSQHLMVVNSQQIAFSIIVTSQTPCSILCV